MYQACYQYTLRDGEIMGNYLHKSHNDFSAEGVGLVILNGKKN